MVHLVNWRDLTENATAPGITKRVMQGTNATMVMVTVSGGISAAKHDHPHEQFVQVIAGTGTLETEEGRRRFGPGDLFHFPEKTWHAATFETDTILIETNLAQ